MWIHIIILQKQFLSSFLQFGSFSSRIEGSNSLNILNIKTEIRILRLVNSYIKLDISRTKCIQHSKYSLDLTVSCQIYHIHIPYMPYFQMAIELLPNPDAE